MTFDNVPPHLGPTEPTAELRVLASALWQMFIALQAEGFNEQQALAVIGHVLAANS